MDIFNQEWLGFAPTRESALNIITQTGIFYLVISGAYALSFLYMRRQSQLSKKIKKIHYLGTSLWAFHGGCLLLYPTVFALFVNTLIVGFALLVLYQLSFTSPLAAQSTLTPSGATDDKKLQYAQTLLAKANYVLSDIVNIALINEQILWLLILYRAVITLRASWGL
ncbi:MAG: hypothetical protein K0R76_333 [Alphaproteobacteria bacterium]|jgi:hypothetical protein|nr:hypothetical protein [Alphaproteobacteria bacterium]